MPNARHEHARQGGSRAANQFSSCKAACELRPAVTRKELLKSKSKGGQMDEIDTLHSSTDADMESLRPGQRHPVEASSGQQERHEEDEEALLSAGKS